MKILSSFIVYDQGIPKLLHQLQLGWATTELTVEAVKTITEDEANTLIITSPHFIQPTTEICAHS